MLSSLVEGKDRECADLIWIKRDLARGRIALKQACEMYDRICAEKCPPVILANAAFIFAQCCEGGFMAALNLEPASDDAWAISQRILKQGRVLYPRDAELRFWEKHLPWWLLGEDFPIADSVEMVKTDPSCLIPLFFLQSFPGEAAKYQKQLQALIDQCRSLRTMKHRFILSVLNVPQQATT